MKIGSDKPEKLSDERLNASDKTHLRHSQQTSGVTSSEDRVEISARALDLQKMAELATAAPDVRADQVSRIRAELAGGGYRVSAEGIAEKLMAEETIDKVV